MLNDKVVLVVGAGRGIGREIALAAATRGNRVVLVARSQGDINQVRDAILTQGNTQALAVAGDVSRAQDVEAVLTKTEATFGRVDALVCAAGILGPIGPFEETPFETWERTIRINLLGAARFAHAVAKGMKTRSSGRILFFSGGGQGPQPRRTAYVSSKGAIWRLTESLGAELAPFGVYVNAIAPGPVNTRFLDDLLEAGPERAGEAEYHSAVAQKRSGGTSPQKAVDLALFLLSDRSAGLYGKILSAVWDDYLNWTNLEAISGSDLYTAKRVVRSDGGTR